MRISISGLLLSTFVLSLCIGGCSQTAPKNTESETSQLLVGAAVRNITPTKQMFPLFRGKNEFGGILDSIHVRAIAIASGGTTTLMLCSETIVTPIEVVEAVAKHTGLPLEAILATATHNHTAPTFSEPLDMVFNDGPRVTKEEVYGKYILDQTLSAVDEALANMKPASVGIGYSESYININRNAPYKRANKSDTVSYGFNPTGISDKTVASIRFNDTTGKPIAFIINYGSHCLIMHNNRIFDGKLGISADIPGIVSGYLEQKYNGSVAIWVSGTAGDQQTWIQNMMFTRNPMTGEQEITQGNSYDMLMYLSKIHFADIETGLNYIKDYTGNAKVSFGFINSVIPAKDSGDFYISLQLLRIGDIGLFGFPGELYTSFGMNMKQKSTLKNTVIITHAYQNRSQSRGYYADDYALEHGGHGTENPFYKPGYLDSSLNSMMNSLIEKTNNYIR